MTKKVGIFAPAQVGDVITTMSVLKYHESAWPGAEIVWFCAMDRSDALKFSPIAEVRPWDAADYMSLKTNSGVGEGMNRLDLEKAKAISSTADLDVGYFPMPWMLERVEQRQGIPYPQISQRIFGVDLSLPWRPCLYFSDEERQMVGDMMRSLPHKRTVMLENSPCDYSPWDDGTTQAVMSMCRKKWGKNGVNFVFASGGAHRSGNDMTRFFDDQGCISASHLTARQASLVNEHCDLFVGVTGALTLATSHWGARPVPKAILTGSEIFGARGIANGRIEIAATDEHGHDRNAVKEVFKGKLAAIRSEIA